MLELRTVLKSCD